MRYIQPVPSFQQEVFRVEVDGTPAYAKRIVSDYSWWTFDDTDIFTRETESYALLNGMGIGPQLLCLDATRKEFAVAELPHLRPGKEAVETFLDNLVILLERLSRLTAPNLQTYTAKAMAALFRSRGEQANVAPVLLSEITQMLNGWHDVYGSGVSYTHGDLHLGNILSDGSNVTGVIDFEETIQSLPVFDATNLSWTVKVVFGEGAYRHFKEAYEKSSGTALIDLNEWGRFCHLRGWIASCYLKHCGSAMLQEKARNFMSDEEPQSHP